jgi:uncharacterized protein with PIN domain
MNNSCPRCGAAFARVRRSFVGRALFRKVQICSACGYREREWRVPFASEAAFVFSRYTRCIECGGYRVRRLSERDHIDRMSAHPLSLVFGVVLAPINHCSPCRLQYRDWRGIRSSDT